MSALATGAFAQGLVIFNNSATTLVTSGAPGNTASISGAAGSFYFGLLTSASGAANTFTFAGNYATNSGVAAGRFLGGTQIVNGWAAGTSQFYEVAGWSASLGPTWTPGWLAGNFGGKSGFFGISGSASGVSGGGNPPAPTLPLFGGTGIASGFNLAPTVPEPSSMALAGLGAAALLIFRRRK